MADEVRMELGFAGGSTAQFSADSAEWEQLQAALTSSDGRWITLTLSDNEKLVLDSSQIIFARAGSVARSVGF